MKNVAIATGISMIAIAGVVMYQQQGGSLSLRGDLGSSSSSSVPPFACPDDCLQQGAYGTQDYARCIALYCPAYNSSNGWSSSSCSSVCEVYLHNPVDQRGYDNCMQSFCPAEWRSSQSSNNVSSSSEPEQSSSSEEMSSSSSSGWSWPW